MLDLRQQQRRVLYKFLIESLPVPGEISISGASQNNFNVESNAYFTVDESHPMYLYSSYSQMGPNPLNFNYSATLVQLDEMLRCVVAQIYFADELPLGLFQCKSLDAYWTDRAVVTTDSLFH